MLFTKGFQNSLQRVTDLVTKNPSLIKDWDTKSKFGF